MCVIASAYTMVGGYLVDNQQYLNREERRTYSRHADRHSPYLCLALCSAYTHTQLMPVFPVRAESSVPLMFFSLHEY